MTQSIELSIEETNKLRAQLGLPLIPTTETSPKKHEKSGLDVDEINTPRISLRSNPLDLLDSRSAKRTAKDGSGTDKVIENRSENDSKLSLDKISENSKFSKVIFHYDEVDADSWLDTLGSAKQVQPALKTSTTHEFDDDNSPKTTIKHSAKKLGQLEDGEIFTLADSGVLDEGDELINETLTRDEKLIRDQREREKEAFLKSGKPRPTREDESDGPDLESAVLEGSMISLKQNVAEKVDEETSGHNTHIQGFFDDLETPKAIVSMKKLKTKKPKSSTKRKREEDSIVDMGPMYTAQLDAVDEPEDDLEQFLSVTRAKKSKARKLLTAEEIAEEVKLHNRVDLATEVDSGIVYDDTKDFLDTIVAVSAERQSGSTTQTTSIDKLDDKPMDASNTEVDERPKEKDRETVNHKGKHESNAQNDTSESVPVEQSTEPNLSSISATLKYLRSKADTSIVEGPRKTKAERERQREAELAKIQINIEERLVREEMAKDPVFVKMKAEEQEKVIDRNLNQRLVQKGIIVDAKKGGKYSRYSGPADPLKDYSPQVNVEYTDSRGNKLDKKQAWKELSHRYHGSMPKNKKEPAVHKSTEERVIH